MVEMYSTVLGLLAGLCRREAEGFASARQGQVELLVERSAVAGLAI